MKKTLKRIGIIVLVLIILALCTIEPAEPQGDVPTYMSDCVTRR